VPPIEGAPVSEAESEPTTAAVEPVVAAGRDAEPAPAPIP
jgi:hypothetical protein